MKDEEKEVFANMAFPVSFTTGNEVYTIYGLSKREYFAGLAMQGLLANPSITGTTGTDSVAWSAVTMADKLLKELNSNEHE